MAATKRGPPRNDYTISKTAPAYGPSSSSNRFAITASRSLMR